MKCKFLNEECNIVQAHYKNDRRAIWLVSPEDGEPMAVATVNLPDDHIDSDTVAIKGWSENSGMEQCLIDAGVIEPEEVGRIDTGFTSAGVYRLTDEYLEEYGD